MTAEATINEARQLANLLVEQERGRQGSVDLAINRVSAKIMVEEGAIRSLRYRWRELKSIPAHVLENLRAGYEHFYERQRSALIHEIELAEALGEKSPMLEARVRAAKALVGEEAE